MTQDEDKGFFDRLGDILNAPLPGTHTPEARRETATQDDDDDSLLERIKDILSTPLPGTPQAEAGAGAPATDERTGGSLAADSAGQAGVVVERPHEPTPELDEDDLDQQWWKQDWAAFRAHQQRERSGLDMKQQNDLEKFTAYQQQEQQRFDSHQQQELDAFTRQQHWRLTAWQQAAAARPGQTPPPPPWGMPPQGMPPGMPPRGPMGGPPPWLQPRGPGRRR